MRNDENVVNSMLTQCTNDELLRKFTVAYQGNEKNVFPVDLSEKQDRDWCALSYFSDNQIGRAHV